MTFIGIIVNHYSDSHIFFFAGDLNLPNINWDTSHISSFVYFSNPWDTVIDFVKEYGFTQTATLLPTETTSLTYFFTNRLSLVRSCHTVPEISDHKIVVVQSLIFSVLQANTLRITYISRLGINLQTRPTLHLPLGRSSLTSTTLPILGVAAKVLQGLFRYF